MLTARGAGAISLSCLEGDSNGDGGHEDSQQQEPLVLRLVQVVKTLLKSVHAAIQRFYVTFKRSSFVLCLDCDKFHRMDAGFGLIHPAFNQGDFT